MFKRFSYQDEEGNEPSMGADTQPSPEVIAMAVEGGWVPKDKWTGPEDKWIDAQTYVSKGEKVLPIVLKHNRDLRKQLKEVQEAQNRLIEEGKTFRTVVERQVKAEYEGKLQEALEQKVQALNDGDGAAVVAAEKEIATLEQARTKALEAATPKLKGDGLHPDFAPWLAENPWWETDEDLQAAGNGIAISLARKDNTLVGRPLFNKVKTELTRLFPDKFKQPKAMEGVEENGNRPMGTRGGGGKTFNDLPAEAKQGFVDAVRREWTKDTKEAKAEYAKIYFEKEGN